MTVSLQSLLVDIWRVFSAQDDATQGLTAPLLTSTIGGAATGLRDASLKRGTLTVDRYNGLCVTILEDVASGPEPLEDSWVADGGFDGTDALTVSPAFSATTQTGTDYLLWPPGLSGNMVKDEIDRVLRKTDAPYLWIPSLIPDADFDSADVTNWAAFGSVDTREFVTTAPTASANPYLLGERALHLIGDDDEGAQSLPAFVTENEQLHVSVVGHAVSGSSYEVRLYDNTAGATIKAVTALRQQHFTEARFTESVPADCRSIRILALSEGTDFEFYIQPQVVVQSALDRLYLLPSWLASPSQVEGAVYVRQGHPSEAADSFVAYSEEWMEAPLPEYARGDRFLNPGHVRLQGGSEIIGLRCQRPFSAITVTANTSLSGITTPADREYVVAKVVANLKKRRREDDWSQFALEGERLRRSLRYGENNVTLRQNETVMV